MSTKVQRDLTTLEYMVLGLISINPQSGYSIITVFESDIYRWSASPGSIYPILKRLEKQGFLAGELEVVHETRPRKMYNLTPLGEETLDEWLRRSLTKREVSVERDIVLRKFLIAENRLTHPEIMAWLDDYEEGNKAYKLMVDIPSESGLDQASIHYQLLVEAVKLELEMQQTWIETARRRLTALAEE